MKNDFAEMSQKNFSEVEANRALDNTDIEVSNSNRRPSKPPAVTNKE